MLWRSAESELELELDEWTRELRLGGVVLNLPPKCFELMRFLVYRSERVVSRQELFEAVWPGVQVTQSSLNQVVSLLRSELGPESQRILRTVRGSGYQLATFIRVPRKSECVPKLAAARLQMDEGDVEELCSEAIVHLERVTKALQALMVARSTNRA